MTWADSRDGSICLAEKRKTVEPSLLTSEPSLLTSEPSLLTSLLSSSDRTVPAVFGSAPTSTAPAAPWTDRRLVKYKESELRFLHEPNVPANNSLAERLARVFKRKQKQATVLRSNKSFECLCNSLGPLYILRVDGDNMFAYVQKIFDRPKSKPSEDAA